MFIQSRIVNSESHNKRTSGVPSAKRIFLNRAFKVIIILRYGELLAKIAFFSYPSLIRRPRFLYIGSLWTHFRDEVNHGLSSSEDCMIAARVILTDGQADLLYLVQRLHSKLC